MEGVEIITSSSIIVISFFVGYLVKQTPLDNKWIPVICAGTGMIVSILGFIFNVPGLPATDIISAAASGIYSGFAATGAHQVYKQFKNSNTDSSSSNSSDSTES